MLLRTGFVALVLAVVSVDGYCQAVPDKGAEGQGHMAKAQQYLSQRRPDLAVPEFEAVLALDPSNVKAQANLGVLLYFKNDFAKAAPHLKKAVEADPTLWKIEALLGLSELHLGDDADARTDMEAALPHLNGDKVQLELGQALIESYSQSGELDKAARVASVLLAANPTDPKLLLMSYRLYTDAASKSILTLALTAPHSGEMHLVMARELQRQGNEAAAAANYKEAIEADPTLPGVYDEYGVLLYNSTDPKYQAQAGVQFQAALAANPRDEKGQLMMGEVDARNGDLKAAEEADAKAVGLDPNDVDACTEYAKILISLGDKVKARTLLEHAIEVDPTDQTAHFRLSTLDRQEGKLDESKKELAEYQKYKEMKAKLQTIFHDMRTPNDDKAEDENAAPK